jgi:hypothetical protein
MEAILDKVMQTFGMMNTLTDQQAENAEFALADFLSNNPQDDEHKATVERLTFLRSRGA